MKLPTAGTPPDEMRAQLNLLGAIGTGQPEGPLSWQQQILCVHRRYRSGNGDGLSGSLTLAIMLGTAPCLVFTTIILHHIDPATETFLGSELPGSASFPLLSLAAVFTVYTALGVIRSLRGAIRTMSDNPIGSGVPPLDGSVDLRRGIEVIAVIALGSIILRNSSPLATTVVLCAASGLICYWALSQFPLSRASHYARIRSAVLLTIVAASLLTARNGYEDFVGDRYNSLYGQAASLFMALVLIKIWARALVWSAAWASTGHVVEHHPNQPLAVIIPILNEEKLVESCLASLTRQTDPNFSVVIVDNGSTDETTSILTRLIPSLPYPVHLLHEPERGIGCAVDTGMQYAISNGYPWLARTDADTLADPRWIASVKRALSTGIELAYGASLIRKDETPTRVERLYPHAVRVAGIIGTLHPRNRISGRLQPLPLASGHNMALTAALYTAVGGIPRIRDVEAAEDLLFANKARTVSVRIRRVPDMRTYTSLRRLRAWGPARLVRWRSWRTGSPSPSEEDTYVR